MTADPSFEPFVAWAKAHASPIALGALPEDLSDLAPIAPIVGPARIVGFGESQHHVGEFSRLRSRLFRFLVEEMDFDTFVFECGVVESKSAHDYVLGRHDDADAAFVPIESGFNAWREFQDLLRWMRAHNLQTKRDRPLKFYGMDGSRRWMSTRRAVAFACDYLERVNPERGRKFRAELTPVAEALGLANAGEASPADLRALVHGVSDLVGHLQIEQMHYIEAAGFEDFDWALRAALVARQIAAVLSAAHADPSGRQRYRWELRDAGMASTLKWILEREGPRARLFVGAHNVHLQKTLARGDRATVGRHLALRLPAPDVVMIAGTNDFSLKPDDPAIEGSFQWALARTGLPSFVLDLRAIAQDEGAAAWFAEERPDRSNVGYQSLDVLRAWDAVYFTRRIGLDTLSLPGPFARRFVELEPSRLVGLEGVYDVAGIGDHPVVLRVLREGDRLHTDGAESDGELFPMHRAALSALSDTRFAWPEWVFEVEFDRDAQGVARGLELRAPGAFDAFRGVKRE